ncbi:MAG: ATP-dependent sacrificial sulfur transferase LarE [Planctomycetota bacterium]
MSVTTELESKRERALEILRGSLVRGGKLAVAFSGGVDSTLLLKLAATALPADSVLAVTARSESLPQDELEACRRLARTIGVRLIELRTNELARPGYVENSGQRCYHCKSELFDTLDRELKAREEIEAVAYGLTADDLGEFRPGMKAAFEHKVLRPLADSGLGKQEIRALSRDYGLETWDKPAMACLASRIPYGSPVTAEKLSQVERAEMLLRSLGFRELRVRHHDETARIELSAEEISRAAANPVRDRIAQGLRALGFKFITLDLEGFRSGRMNETLGEPRRLPVT